MEKWHKYSVVPGDGSVVRVALDLSYQVQSELMGWYHPTDAYSSKDAFRKFYLQGRYVIWDEYIRQNITKENSVFSIASGRCINELLLREEGYRFDCSDLAVPDCYEHNQRLFGPYSYVPLDIVNAAPPAGRYDTVLCLSLIYLFDDASLRRFFSHVAEALPVGGRLILDSSGSEQSLLGILYYRGFLKGEAYANYWTRRLAAALGLSQQRWSLVVHHHGYRRKSREIAALARESGLHLVRQKNYDPLTDIQRSPLLCRLSQQPGGLVTKALVRTIGQRLKYIRMFTFEKKEAR